MLLRKRCPKQEGLVFEYTMLMGQAAGFAASISLASDCEAKGVAISKLQDQIIEQRGILDTPSKIADINRNGWNNNFK